MIEFMPWYHAGDAMLRCSGDGGCGALLVSGDTELHAKWHERIERIEVLAVGTADVALGVTSHAAHLPSQARRL